MMCRTMTVGRCRPDRRLLHLHAGDGMRVSEEGASLLLVRVGSGGPFNLQCTRHRLADLILEALKFRFRIKVQCQVRNVQSRLANMKSL